jgi:hypothetical protein
VTSYSYQRGLRGATGAGGGVACGAAFGGVVPGKGARGVPALPDRGAAPGLGGGAPRGLEPGAGAEGPAAGAHGPAVGVDGPGAGAEVPEGVLRPDAPPGEAPDAPDEAPDGLPDGTCTGMPGERTPGFGQVQRTGRERSCCGCAR